MPEGGGGGGAGVLLSVLSEDPTLAELRLLAGDGALAGNRSHSCLATCFSKGKSFSRADLKTCEMQQASPVALLATCPVFQICQPKSFETFWLGGKSSGFNTGAPLAKREGLPFISVFQCFCLQHVNGSMVEEGCRGRVSAGPCRAVYCLSSSSHSDPQSPHWPRVLDSETSSIRS